MTDMAPDGGAGVVPIVYMMPFPPAFGGGVHSMVTVDCPIPWMGRREVLRRTSLGEPAEHIVPLVLVPFPGCCCQCSRN